MGRTYQSIVINAPVEKGWKALSDFHDMSWAKGIITNLTPVGDLQGNQIGARREAGVFSYCNRGCGIVQAGLKKLSCSKPYRAAVCFLTDLTPSNTT